MAHPERPIGPVLTTFINMAIRLTGVAYPYNRSGLSAATAVLREQHERVRLQAPIDIIRALVIARDPIIRTTEEEATQAIIDGNYAAALRSSNHLHGYGDVDYKDSLGGEAFPLSLNAHRLFAGTLVSRFGDTDSFLKPNWPEIFPDIRQAAESGDSAGELELLRGVVHKVALNGTLGEDTKRYFDPFALGETM